MKNSGYDKQAHFTQTLYSITIVQKKKEEEKFYAFLDWQKEL